ncbi:MAG: hypothetical protein ACT4QG_01620 [Sporichthyaceae bacterium]
MLGHVLIPAHGVSSRQDLPLPFGYALTGALAAMAVSFLALAFWRRQSHYSGDESGRPLPEGLAAFLDSPEMRGALRVLGLLLVGFVSFAAFAGPDLATNPTAGFVYVIFWVGLVPVSLLFGPVWRLLNPLRTIHLGLTKALRLDPDEGLYKLPAWVGYWPAAAGIFGFVWLELCAPERDSTGTLRTWFGIYAGLNLIGAVLFGRRWFARCDGFEVFSTLIGRLSVLGRRTDGVLVVRSPLANLDGIRQAPGLVPVVAVMLGSTAFDSVTSTSWWFEHTSDSSWSPTTLATLALSGSVAAVALAFCIASWLSGLLGDGRPRGMPAQFAHSLVPIAVGYLIAHYFSLLVFAGQQTLIRASDPLVEGQNWFGTANLEVNYDVLSVTAIATLQVVAIVTGHVLGVFSAHDRAVRLFPPKAAVLGQIPMMILMIAYTFGGLTLLFSD